MTSLCNIETDFLMRMRHPFLNSYHHHPYYMDALLSQLKGQGSPFSSPQPKPIANTDKLLDTIHLLSQATLLVAQQLQERPTQLPTPPLTPKSSPVLPAKKTPPPKRTSAPMLSWVPRAPEYYRLPPPNPNTATQTSVPIPAKPTLRTPHTKKDRKPKSKRTKPSTQPNPSPTPPAPNPSPTPSATTLATPSRPVQTDQREPTTQPHPLPTPTSSSPAQPEQRQPGQATLDLRKRRQAKKEAKRKLAALSPTPTPEPTPKPPSPIYEDVTAPIAPANAIVNFPHPYDDCPRLPECPAHKVEFAVYSQAYADRSRDAPRPPPYPQLHAG